MATENKKFIGTYIDENNNPINEPGFIGWHSRSIAVTCIITNKEHTKFLVERRGPGCPDFIGKLCCPCGYLGWDETLEEAAIREVYEETGIKLDETCDIHMIGIQDDPKDSNKQNVTVRFVAECNNFDEIIKYANCNTFSRGGEKDECSELLIITPEEIKYMPSDTFAFNHAQLILKVAQTITI